MTLTHNKIHLGDCLDLMKEIPSESIDCILCDLPYGTTKCKWDTIIPFEPLWEAYERIAKPTAAILLFGVEPFSSFLRLSNLKMYRYDWIWNKKRAGNFLFMNKQPGRVCEYISTFYSKQPTYNPQKILNPRGTMRKHLGKNPSKVHSHLKEVMGSGWSPTKLNSTQNYCGKNYESDKLLPNNLLTFAKDTKRVHPTQKPVELCEYLLKTYTNPRNLVLDNCAGSGTTGIACQNLDRDFILIENDPKYFEISQQRLLTRKPVVTTVTT